ncbi:MAG TPA: DNA-protecting protein DprA [Oscillibacter sp.]|nr:DNA-protecting protein DprA [Oscillibacter sp.]
MAALKYWVWLATLPGLGTRTRLQLLEHFDSPEDIYYADEGELLLTPDITKAQAALLADKSLERTEQVLADCARDGQFILTMGDSLYPDRLRTIFDPPILLYGKGALPMFDDEVAVTVVGTRSCTPYGVRAASQLGYELSKQGALLVSGMAKGIDGAAMRGALQAGGFTAAVLGGGVDVVYPAENRRLYEDIAATGVLLSEYPPGTEPLPGHFPVRNRIISGLSLASLVVEAPVRSGALITAHAALDQGRDVFAVPGPIDAAASVGCNRLIRDGAGLAASGWDILSVYHSRFPHRLHPAQMTVLEPGETPRQEESPPPAQKPEPEAPAAPELPVLDLDRNREGLTDDQLALIRVLDTETPLLTDEAAEQTGLPVRRVLSALTVLEIDGYAQRSGPRSYVRTVRLHSEKEGS